MVFPFWFPFRATKQGYPGKKKKPPKWAGVCSKQIECVYSALFRRFCGEECFSGWFRCFGCLFLRQKRFRSPSETDGERGREGLHRFDAWLRQREHGGGGFAAGPEGFVARRIVVADRLWGSNGCGSKLSNWGYAGFGLPVHLPVFHFGPPFLSQSRMSVSFLRLDPQNGGFHFGFPFKTARAKGSQLKKKQTQTGRSRMADAANLGSQEELEVVPCHRKGPRW